jgi:hypothetical protein
MSAIVLAEIYMDRITTGETERVVEEAFNSG